MCFFLVNLKKVLFDLNSMYCRHSKYLDVHPDLAASNVSFWGFVKQLRKCAELNMSMLARIPDTGYRIQKVQVHLYLINLGYKQALE